MKKRLVSTILIAVMIISAAPVYAKPDKKVKKNKSKVSEIYYEFNPEATQQPVDYEPIVHTEQITEELEFPDENEETTYTARTASAVTTETIDIKWNRIFSEQFGEEYLSPYKIEKERQCISGNTNRLVIEETDLSLKGKNGLDVNIKRKHDNQFYNESYGLIDHGSYIINTSMVLFLYPFKVSSTGQTVNVAFYTEDDFYTYMYEGVDITELPNMKTYDNIAYYMFDDVCRKKTTSENSIRLERDPEGELSVLPTHLEDSRYELVSAKMFRNNIKFGNGWELVIPKVSLIRTFYEKEDKSSSTVRNKEFSGVFRDINGAVIEVTGEEELVDYEEDGVASVYTSSFESDGNKYLKMESFYEQQKLNDEIDYNFVITDNTGLKYYFYNTGMSCFGAENYQEMSVVAISDKYNNIIRYEYNTEYNEINKIIDTYGREINFTCDNVITQITYTDENTGEQKEISYRRETLPSTELVNDSPLKNKPVSRLTVTNEEGEKTIYDSRAAEVLNFYYTVRDTELIRFPNIREEQALIGKAHNIERIIYPTGAESRYKYQLIYPSDKETKISRGVYMVKGSYDIINGNKENECTYTAGYADSSSEEMITTVINNSDGSKIINDYDEDGRLTNSKKTGITSDNIFVSETTEYLADKPETVTVNSCGQTMITNTQYMTGYPGTLTSISKGNKKITYTYHTVNNMLTEMPEIINYMKKTGSSTYTVDYSIETELTADEKAIEYVRVIKDNILHSQTKYEYDSTGNIIKTYIWIKDSDGNGVLDENDEYTVTENTHTINEDKTETVTESISGIVNADGAEEESIVNRYTFDMYGKPLQKTDPYGNITVIEYDKNSRPIAITYPNEARTQIEYNTEECYTEVTDERGVKTRSIYDEGGRLKEEQQLKETKWEPKQKREYEESGRLKKETVFTAEGEGEIRQYEYDILGRVKKITVSPYSGGEKYTEEYIYIYGNR